jgi:hypothetical protein
MTPLRRKRAIMRWHSYQPLVFHARRKRDDKRDHFAPAEAVHGGGRPGALLHPSVQSREEGAAASLQRD